jgi:F0F1-type ATP synthase membrane subunit c/vacuolar-type H+-ATPase subunit K
LVGALAAGVAVALCCAAARLGANISAATASSIASPKARRQKLNFDPE